MAGGYWMPRRQGDLVLLDSPDPRGEAGRPALVGASLLLVALTLRRTERGSLVSNVQAL